MYFCTYVRPNHVHMKPFISSLKWNSFRFLWNFLHFKRGPRCRWYRICSRLFFLKQKRLRWIIIKPWCFDPSQDRKQHLRFVSYWCKYGRIVAQLWRPCTVSRWRKCQSLAGMVGLAQKWVRLAPNALKSDLKRPPDLSHLGQIWPNLDGKCDILG